MEDSETGPECNNNLVKKLASSKYKGVVPQSNGRWGAQIYEKQRRVWLGTFDEEAEAAKAYDIASIRFRGSNSSTSSRLALDGAEAEFLNSHSKAEIVEMLRSHTYVSELQKFRQRRNSEVSVTSLEAEKEEEEEYSCRVEWLFEKVVTPSDVGKLHRMVIPKKHAELHFPHLGRERESESGVVLSFEDRSGKTWRFRYCFWSSSQSYVLTRGWSRFVKEKQLRAGDVVSFRRWKSPHEKLFIDCRRCGGGGGEVPVVERVVKLFGVEIHENCSGNS